MGGLFVVFFIQVITYYFSFYRVIIIGGDTMNKTVLKMIDWYQGSVSGTLNSKCRHTPTCSHYAKEAFETYNFPYAMYLSTKRILTCNPLFKPSYDPVPTKKTK